MKSVNISNYQLEQISNYCENLMIWSFVLGVVMALIIVIIATFRYKRKNKIINYNFKFCKKRNKRVLIGMTLQKAYYGENHNLNVKLFKKNLENVYYYLKPNIKYCCTTHDIILKRLKKLEKMGEVVIISCEDKGMHDFSVVKNILRGVHPIKCVLIQWKNKIKCFSQAEYSRRYDLEFYKIGKTNI